MFTHGREALIPGTPLEVRGFLGVSNLTHSQDIRLLTPTGRNGPDSSQDSSQNNSPDNSLYKRPDNSDNPEINPDINLDINLDTKPDNKPENISTFQSSSKSDNFDLISIS